MKDKGKVLIGITSKNRAAILPRAIQSALNQDYDDKIVAVYDDASTDNTSELVSEYPTVKWRLSDKTNGYLYARNIFLREYNADFYASLDDDSWFMTSTDLLTALDYMHGHQQVAVVAFDILTHDNDKKKKVSEPFEVSDFIGCGHLVRVNAVKEAGYYQKMPGFYGGEEKDLSLKLIDLGYTLVKLPGVHVWHDKTMVARDIGKQHRSGVCNDLVFFYRRAPWLVLAPGILIKLYKHIRFGFTHNLAKDAWLGIKDFLYLMITFQIKRLPVRYASLLKFRKLPNA